MPDRRSPIGLPERYRLEGRIAHGGMAVVYAAHDTVLDRPVAVKVLAEHLGQDATARARFEREARAAAALSAHNGVVTIYDVGEHEGRAFIVMERRTGGSVGDRLASGRPIPRDVALRWLHDVADALDAAHDRGIVHRDVKPANLLLDGRDRVAVADFGIASLADDVTVTQTGQVLGSAAYISPEQAMGQPATARSDVYALACVAFELLTGHRPYPGDTFAAQARAHVDDAVPRAAGLPPGAQAALSRGMAKEPRDRPPSTVVLVEGLNAALGAAAPAEGTATRVLPPPPPPSRDPSPTPERAWVGAAAPDERDAQPARRRGGRGLLLVLAVVAVVLIGVVVALGVHAARSGDDKRAQATATPTRTPSDTPEPTSTPEPTETAAQTPEPTATATATATPTDTPTPEPTEAPDEAGDGGPGGDPADLNGKGFDAIRRGDYAAAVAPLQQAVAGCAGSSELDPCGYALFNLGQALNRSGRSAEAIPFLQQRLEGFDFRNGTVRKELRAACAAAGRQDCG